MNIKEAETLSGVSRRNIRFYEQKGLLKPGRNQENDYREYTEADIQTLKLIRALRMVDMPVEQIREIVAGRMPLNTAAAAHKQKLRAQIKALETAVRFCDEFAASEKLDIDEVLCRMDEPVNRENLSENWRRDYADTAIRIVVALAMGLVPCFVGLVFGMIVVGCWFDLPVISYALSILALVLWAGFGCWFRGQGGRLLDCVLVHVIPTVGFVCYLLTVFVPDASYSDIISLLAMGGYYPILFTFTPFTDFAIMETFGAVLPMVLLVVSFLAGVLLDRIKGDFPVGRVLLGAVVLLPVLAIILGIIFTPLSTAVTPETLMRRLSSDMEFWVEDGAETYVLTGSEEFGALLRLEKWERAYLGSGGEPVLVIHMSADRSEPYAIEFYSDGTARVYEYWVTLEEGFFHIPEGLAEAIWIYAKENGILQ